jgi:uncharacterized protein YjiS (DUF1127 family)
MRVQRADHQENIMTTLVYPAYADPNAVRAGVRTEAGSRLRRYVRLVLWLTERQRQRRALLALDDNQLRDIGVSRRQALEEGRKPFWR